MKWIEWVDPYTDDGDPVIMRVKPETAIKAQKAVRAGLNRGEYQSDQQALEDFIVVQWAKEVEYPD